MKKSLVSLLAVLCVLPASAQFIFSATPQIGYNLSKTYFSDFRETYNTINASKNTKELGTPSLLRGYSATFGFRILRLSSSLSRDYLWAHTSATFANGGKRRIDYTYKLTTINVGFFQPGDGFAQFSAEIGMVHAVANQYSYVILPNKERDYAPGGLNMQNNVVNLGMDIQLRFEKPITEYLFLNLQATGIFLNNDKEFNDAIELNGTRATSTLKSVSIGAGLMFQLGEHID